MFPRGPACLWCWRYPCSLYPDECDGTYGGAKYEDEDDSSSSNDEGEDE